MRQTRSRMRRTTGALLALALATAAPAQDVPELATGIRQVQEGDYEGAVPTLEAAIRSLEARGRPAAELARACLHLGVAHVALDQREAALARFRQALGYEQELRLTPDRYSPKVIAVFEEARRDVVADREAEKGEGRSRTPLVLLGVGAAAAAGVVVATTGGDGPAGGGAPSFSGARFTTPVLVCPDGSRDLPLLVGIQVSGMNPADRPLTIRSVTVVLIIVESPGVPSELGFASSAPASVSPTSVAAGGQGALLVETSLLCGNGEGDASRYNEWVGRLTLDTSAGAFALETVDRLRVNIP